MIHEGKIAAAYHKVHLPNYGVFDEKRYFQAGKDPVVFVLKGVIIGITICEDVWFPRGPVAAEAEEGQAEVILNISASPYHVGKGRLREKILSDRARESCAIITVIPTSCCQLCPLPYFRFPIPYRRTSQL